MTAPNPLNAVPCTCQWQDIQVLMQTWRDCFRAVEWERKCGTLEANLGVPTQSQMWSLPVSGGLELCAVRRFWGSGMRAKKQLREISNATTCALHNKLNRYQSSQYHTQLKCANVDPSGFRRGLWFKKACMVTEAPLIGVSMCRSTAPRGKPIERRMIMTLSARVCRATQEHESGGGC